MAAGVLTASDVAIMLDRLADIARSADRMKSIAASVDGDRHAMEVLILTTQIRGTLLRASLSDLKVETPDQPA
jgi:hypothetical protein